MLELYFATVKQENTSNLHLFHGIVVAKDGEQLLKGSLSYNWLRELPLQRDVGMKVPKRKKNRCRSCSIRQAKLHKDM